jgi:phage terminase small subunit
MTDKQTLFIEHYLTHFNATRAAIEAGYSEATARSIGCELSTNPDIKPVIDARIKEIIAQTDDKRAMLIQFWIDIINNPDSSESGKLKASDSLGKYLALFTERIELAGNVTLKNTTFVIENES